MTERNSFRQHFEQRIEGIRHDVLVMGGKVNQLVKLATDSILTGDPHLASQVIELDDEVDRLESEIYRRTMITVLQEAPVAADYKFLMAALGVVGELEKAADDAVKLSRRAKKLVGHFPSELKLALSELGEVSRQMFNASLRLFAEYSEGLASEIVAKDETADDCYSQAREQVIEMIRENPGESEHLVRTIDCFHALEHVADHAVEISKRMNMLYLSNPG
jgi:phosphate transport system protein